ncbi:DUF4838 domain-containing protein [Coraliomargarita sp. SDUM461004]|uniref:DUF4838 domain-containing protein n=1 Tax=Thalassobacterium sedimentorum TaxID=3041258 RepID=A0ABU1AME6_9BACT|nr:DUF4838 domain-containing protein [Coraliomargarita sp. SDUM461004]MDQ8194783.1 DUF4838 domain-containing protein [Coraliomargarita sp. SDUM461004]
MLIPIAAILVKLPRLLSVGLVLTSSLWSHSMAASVKRLAVQEFVWDASSGVKLGAALQAVPEGEQVLQMLSYVLEGATGQVVEAGEDVERGIYLGLPADAPQLAEMASLSEDDAFGREDYLLYSTADCVYVIGATGMAVRHGVVDLVNRWGYRRFFPTSNWEVFPAFKDLRVKVNVVESPAYVVRDIFDVNFLPGEKELFLEWRDWNRLGSGFGLKTKHSYDGIFLRNREAFDGHPEYFAMVDGERTPDAKYKKFNVSNPDLQQIVLDDARARLEALELSDSVSMDPSDFGGWDNSGESFEELGSPTNQAVSLANLVAREVAAPEGKFVGMYAYYQHQSPPTIEVEPNLIVSFATRFLSPGRDLVESISAWRAQGLEWVGIRDYASFWGWDLGMPGFAEGGNLAYQEDSLQMYYDLGARFYTSEVESNWGAYGLGVYVTSRLLWSPDAEVSELVADFLEKSFGPAAEVMASFYDKLNGEKSVLAQQTPVQDYYAILLEAGERAVGREDVQARIDDLIAYVRYVELMSELQKAREDDKQQYLMDLYRWTFRISPQQMVATRAMAFRPRNGGIRYTFPTLKHPDEAERAVLLDTCVGQAVTRAELRQLAQASIASAKPDAWSNLPIQDRMTRSPRLRFGAALLFPMERNEQVSVSVSMRLFGFSWLPRYMVLDPTGEVVASGRVKSLNEAIMLNSTQAGEYLLVFERTLIQIQASSSREFYLLPSADFQAIAMVRFSGDMNFSLPAGASSQIAVGGQGGGERVGVSIINEAGVLLAEEGEASGDEPLILDLPLHESMASYNINLRGPTSGNFEDAFIHFQGGNRVPLRMGPLDRAAAE